MKAVGLAILLTGLMVAPAQAQPAPDPIDALLRAPADPEEPDTAATGASVEPDPALPAAPQPYVPPRPALTAPVFVNEIGKTPEAPPSPADLAYDSRLKSSAASVRSFQGPMDGGWTLSAGGRPLYALQLTDRNGAVEGAWRDLRRVGALDASGFFDLVERSDAGLTFHFSETSTAVLRQSGGGWTGQLTEAGRSEPVTLARRAP